jgi:hypothetical protein
MQRLNLKLTAIVTTIFVILVTLLSANSLLAQTTSSNQFAKLNNTYTQNTRLSAAQRKSFISRLKAAPGFNLCTYRKQSLRDRATFYALGMDKIIGRYSYLQTRIDEALKITTTTDSKLSVLELLSSDISIKITELKQVQTDVETIFEQLESKICDSKFSTKMFVPLVAKLDQGAKISSQLEVILTDQVTSFLEAKL